MASPRLRLALDQNFPVMVLDSSSYFPEVELLPISRIDPRAGGLDDRELVIYLSQQGWHGLITNNYKMLNQPTEIAAIVKAKLALVAIEGLGDDPLRATGALLLHLPAIVKQITIGQAQIFRLSSRPPNPEPAWECFRRAAERRHEDVAQLYEAVKVTDEEFGAPVLDRDR